MRKFLGLFLLVALIMILSLPFSNAIADKSLSQLNGSKIKPVDAVPDASESTELPIYVQVDQGLKEITLINPNGVPVDLYVLAMDAEGYEIASYSVFAFSDTKELKLKVAEIFRGVPEGRIASVKVIGDEPFIVLKASNFIYDKNPRPNDKNLSVLQQGSTQEIISPQLIIANPLPVVFKAQYPPGSWTYTKNCGQASSLMVMCYHNNTTPTEQGIKNIDDWLYSHYHDPINNYNGSITDTTRLEALVKQYGGFVNSYKASGWNIDNIKSKINEGLPVIAAVTIQCAPYNFLNGHFVVVTGYTATQIITNDPGLTLGEKKYYTNAAFSAALQSQGGAVVVVVPNSSTCSDFGESNGSFSTAYSLTCGTTSTAKICSSSDLDFYKVTPSISGTMTIRLTPPSDKDFDLYIYNSSQAQIGSSTSGTGVQDVCNVPATGGQTYYIKVIGYNGAYSTTSNYSLAISCPTSSCVATVSSDHWKGEYYNNKTLSGSTQMVRDDGTGSLNFDWGTGSPSSTCGIGSDNFSARWTRTVYFSVSGTYRFTVTADDGVRLWVDGILKIDKWLDQVATFTADVSLSAGNHTIKMEYYENGGGAVAKLSWQQQSTLTPTLLIDGGTSSTRAQNSTFSFSGANYTANGTVSRYLTKPDGSTMTLATVPANSSGNVSWPYPSTCADATGTYSIRAMDNATGKYSNWVYEVITASSSCSTNFPNLTPYKPSAWSDKIVVSKTTGTNIDSSPLYTTDTLYVDWAVANLSSFSISTTFYTKLYVDSVLKNTWNTISLQANYYTSPLDYSIGKLSAGAHTIKIATDATGVIAESNESDNEYTKTITIQASSATPTLLIDGGSSSTKSQGSTFNFTGSNYTANGTVSRYLTKPDGSTMTLATVTASSSGGVIWPYPSTCADATGTYSIRAMDNATGKYSNWVNEVITANSSCSSTDTALQNAVPVSSSISSGQWKYYYIDVPSGVSKLEIKITDLTSDVDLYTLYNAKPTSTRPYWGGTSSETCMYSNPSAGKWWAGVYGYSAASYRITATVTTAAATPTIAMSPMYGPPGTVFTESGTGFTPNSTATLYFPKYDGVNNGSSQVGIDAQGHFQITYPSGSNKPPGTYKWYAIDGPTGIKSNEVSYGISVKPTIAMSPMSGRPGTVFTEWGTGFTPNSTATLYFPKYDGVNNGSSQVSMDAQGHFEITYPSGSNKPRGTYKWYAIDGPTGIKSNEVSYTIN